MVFKIFVIAIKQHLWELLPNTKHIQTDLITVLITSAHSCYKNGITALH